MAWLNSQLTDEDLHDMIRALTSFMSGWNHHPISTAHNKSPHMLFAGGMLLLQHSQLTALDFFTHVDSEYGVDDDGPVPSDEESSVEVSPNTYQTTEANYTLLQNSVHLLSPSDDYGIDLYEQTLSLI